MKQCEHLEKPKTGRDPYFFYPTGEEAGFLCEKCAASAGFCYFCGEFYAGVDGEEGFLYKNGACRECVAEIEEDQ